MIFERIKNLSTPVKVRTHTGNSLNIRDNSLNPLLERGAFGDAIISVGDGIVDTVQAYSGAFSQ